MTRQYEAAWRQFRAHYPLPLPPTFKYYLFKASVPWTAFDKNRAAAYDRHCELNAFRNQFYIYTDRVVSIQNLCLAVRFAIDDLRRGRQVVHLSRLEQLRKLMDPVSVMFQREANLSPNDLSEYDGVFASLGPVCAQLLPSIHAAPTHPKGISGPPVSAPTTGNLNPQAQAFYPHVGDIVRQLPNAANTPLAPVDPSATLTPSGATTSRTDWEVIRTDPDTATNNPPPS